MAFNATLVTAECFAIVPSTNGVTRFTAFGFYVGTGGDVNVIDGHGHTGTLQGRGDGNPNRASHLLRTHHQYHGERYRRFRS